MRLALHVLGRIAARATIYFVALAASFAFVAVLEAARRDPRLGALAALELAPTLAIYAAGSLLLASLAAAAAGVFAELEQHRELTAAAALGVGPLRWIGSLALLALALTPWCWQQAAEVLPAARAARASESRALLRSPAACARGFAERPRLAPQLVVDCGQAVGNEFADARAVELGADALPRAASWARRARVDVPPERDVLVLELDDATRWAQLEGGGLERVEARSARIALPLAELAERRRTGLRAEIAESSFAELAKSARVPTGGEARRLARAERASRIGLAFAPFALLLAGAALGLALARHGGALASLAGLALFGGVYLPLHASALRAIAAGAPEFVRVGVDLAVALPALYFLARWRGR